MILATLVFEIRTWRFLTQAYLYVTGDRDRTGQYSCQYANRMPVDERHSPSAVVDSKLINYLAKSISQIISPADEHSLDSRKQ